MSWSANDETNELSMARGDFGIQLPIKIEDITLASGDSIKIAITSRMNGTAIIEKEYTNIQNSTVNLELTEAESAKLPVGNYFYILDWYQDGNFMCNIINDGVFRVVKKACN